MIVALDVLAAAVLCLWAGGERPHGAVVLSGAIQRADVNRHALRWHVSYGTPGFSSGALLL